MMILPVRVQVPEKMYVLVQNDPRRADVLVESEISKRLMNRLKEVRQEEFPLPAG